MSLADLFTAIRGYEDEVQQLTSDRETLRLKLADLQNQLVTAALQHGNDQQAIDDLSAKLKIAADEILSDEKDIKDLVNSVANANLALAKAQADLSTLQSTVTYPDLEWGLWQLNKKPDAASGLGDSTFVPANDFKNPALFSIFPDPPLTGEKDNFFNVYATQKKKPNTLATKFVLRGQFDFPTDTDMRNAHCIEFEGRQVLPKPTALPLPLMAVPAWQANFSGNEFRYFTGTNGWASTGIPMPRQRTVSVVMEAHRDDKTLFYDAFTINGQRHAVSFQAPLYAKTYVNERLSVSLQLDSHYLGGPFKVIPSGVSLEVR